MKRKFSLSISSVCALFSLALSLHAQSLPKNATFDDFRIDPDLIHIRNRAPIQFRAFEVRDPETGRVTTADSVLTLPDGRRMKAGDFYAALNRLERDLNALGHSLRDKTPSVELQETIALDPELQTQVRELQQDLPKQQGIQRIDVRVFEKDARASAQLRRSPGLKSTTTTNLARVAKKLVKIAPKKVLKTKVQASLSHSKFLGKKSLFAAYWNTSTAQKGQEGLLESSANASFGAYVFNKKVEMLKASVVAKGGGSNTARVTLSAAGKTLVDTSKPTLFADSFSKGFDVSAKIHFMLGPIPCSAKVGVKGSAYLQLLALATDDRASLMVKPSLNAKAYIQFGVDIFVAGAGAWAKLTILDLDAEASAFIQRKANNGQGTFFMRQYCWVDVAALKGSLGVEAWIYVPAFSIPPWTKKTFTWTIFKWGGFKWSGFLFNYQKDVPLEYVNA